MELAACNSYAVDHQYVHLVMTGEVLSQTPSAPMPEGHADYNDGVVQERRRREIQLRTRSYIMAEACKKTKNPNYNGVASNAVTVMLSQVPQPTGANSEIWTLLSTGMAAARGKRRYKDLIDELLKANADVYDWATIGINDRIAIAFDNLEFASKVRISPLLLCNPPQSILLDHPPR